MYTVKFVNDEEFEKLPGKNMQDKVGVAYPEHGIAFARQSGMPVLDVFTALHELEHLKGDDLDEHYDSENGCYYKGKGMGWLAPALIGASFLIPGIGPAIGGALSSAMGGLGTAASGLGGMFSGALGAVPGIGGALSGGASALGSGIGSAASGIGSALSGAGSSFAGAGKAAQGALGLGGTGATGGGALSAFGVPTVASGGQTAAGMGGALGSGVGAGSAMMPAAAITGGSAAGGIGGSAGGGAMSTLSNIGKLGSAIGGVSQASQAMNQPKPEQQQPDMSFLMNQFQSPQPQSSQPNISYPQGGNALNPNQQQPTWHF